MVVLAIAAGLALYSSMGEDAEVLVLTRTVLAGEPVSAADVRVVSVSSEDDVSWVPASQRDQLIGQYARYRLARGAFLTSDAVQPARLVTPGWVLMSVQVPVGEVPIGLRERSNIVLVVTGPGADGDVSIVDAVVAAVPSNLASSLQDGDRGGNDLMALSVEVPAELVGIVGTASSVSLGVVDPSSALSPAEQPATVGSSEPDAGGDEAEPAVTEAPVAETLVTVAPTTVALTTAAPVAPAPTAAPPTSSASAAGAGG